MSFIRASTCHSPSRLDQLAGITWARFILKVLQDHRHLFADHLCLRTIRAELNDHLQGRVPLSLQEDLFQHGLTLLKKEVNGDPFLSLDDLLTPDMFVLYMFVCYKPDVKSLEVPELVRKVDKVTVLDILYNLGSPYGHQLDSLKIKMFQSSQISSEESYLAKRVLRGFRCLKSLILWKAADDAMLQIIGLTCHQLEILDLWKSINVTDQGIRMLLGLDGERCTNLRRCLKQVMVKDTAVTDEGAYNILLYCPAVTTLEFSHSLFIKQFLERVESGYKQTGQTFPQLRSIFLPTLSSESLFNIIKSFPGLDELGIWTSLPHLPEIKRKDLNAVQTLKVGGLNFYSILSEINTLIGSQITSLKIETVHFDINLDSIGVECPNIEDLSIINARIGATLEAENAPSNPIKMFSNLRKVYFFLVTYLHSSLQQTNTRTISSVASPTGVPNPSTGYTALHFLLKHGPQLENVQVTGSPAFTDSCLESILLVNPLVNLCRLIISNPSITDDQPLVVPLTSRSVHRLRQSCPNLQCLGDLSHWAITPTQHKVRSHRPSMIRSSIPVLQQNVWTKVQISGARRAHRSTSVLYQGTAAAVV